MKNIRTLLEGELEKAEATLAARNLVDEIQDMLQSVSKLQVEDLAALNETMRANMSPEIAQAFNTSASQALQTVVDCLTQAKTDLDNAVMTATDPTGASAIQSAEPTDSGLDGLDALGNGDAPVVDPSAAGGELPLGRAQREEGRNSIKQQIEALEGKLREAKRANKKAV